MALIGNACSRPTALHRRAIRLVAALAALAAAAPAQTGPCGLGNLRNFCITEDSPGVTDSSEAGDRFGAALAFGDFDGNGALDLAVGVPGEGSDAGAVRVFYSHGLVPDTLDQQDITQGMLDTGAFGGTEAGDQFGFSLAAGDVNGDGYADLVVGVPYEDVDDTFGNCVTEQCLDVGVAHLIYGSPTGLDRTDSAAFQVQTDWDHDYHFGYAVAVGLLSNDGFPEIAIGSPGARDGGLARYGRVDVFQGDPVSVPQRVAAFQIAFPGDEAGGDEQGAALVVGRFAPLPDRQLVYAAPRGEAAGSNQAGRIEVATFDNTGFQDNERFLQSDFGSAGNAGDDHFGSALAVGDFNGDHLLDLAIGAPDKNDLDASDSGRVYVAYGSGAGLVTTTFQILRWNAFPNQTAENNDRLGAALAAGDSDGDGFDDLFIGSPRKGNDDRGLVYFMKGGPNGLAVGAGYNFSELTLSGTVQADARFGSVLALADVDGDGVDEVAIGVPGRDVSGASDAGLVYVSRRFEPQWVFGDGFESGGPSLWSVTAP